MHQMWEKWESIRHCSTAEGAIYSLLSMPDRDGLNVRRYELEIAAIGALLKSPVLYMNSAWAGGIAAEGSKQSFPRIGALARTNPRDIHASWFASCP
jgi:hypothetical protein